MLIAQITDTHIRPKGKLLHHMVHTARYLRRCIEQLEALTPRPDVVIATGDLVEGGKPKEYRRLRHLLARLSIPLLVVPGNHDDRNSLREAFADHTYLPRRGPLHWLVDAGSVRLVGLDSTRPGQSAGAIDQAQLAWLADVLAAAPTRPTFVFMHHPPYPVGVPVVDAKGFRKCERFQRLVERNPQIVRIASGHVHRYTERRIGDTLATSAPSTAHQLVLVPTEWGGYGLRLEAPAFTLHGWDGVRAETTLHPVQAVALRNVSRFDRPSPDRTKRGRAYLRSGS